MEGGSLSRRGIGDLSGAGASSAGASGWDFIYETLLQLPIVF
jgi:hypothetical protein